MSELTRGEIFAKFYTRLITGAGSASQARWGQTREFSSEETRYFYKILDSISREKPTEVDILLGIKEDRRARENEQKAMRQCK